MGRNRSVELNAAKRRIIKLLGGSDRINQDGNLDLYIEFLEFKNNTPSTKQSNRTFSIKKVTLLLIKYLGLKKKREALMKTLASGEKIPIRKLIEETDTGKENDRKKKVANLKNLIFQVRKVINKKIPDGKDKIIIKPLRGQPFSGYQLVINSSLVRNSTPKS